MRSLRLSALLGLCTLHLVVVKGAAASHATHRKALGEAATSQVAIAQQNETASSTALASPHTTYTNRQLQTCKIYVLDIGQPAGTPNSTFDDEIISLSGSVFRSDDSRMKDAPDRLPHWTSQHAGPYWLKDALLKSNYSVSSLEEADAVYVYDYEGQMQYLSRMHTPDNVRTSLTLNNVTKDLDSAYQAISQLPRFQKHQGRDFAFFYSHPLTYEPIEGHHCGNMSNSLKLVLEAGQVNVCPSTEAKENALIVPYSSPEFVTDQEDGLVRDTFMFFIGSCHETANLGKRMRHRLGTLDGQLPDKLNSTVSCSQKLPHEQLRHKLRTTKFCLLPPGDTSSSRRLTEVMLAGCIPVFIGGPWHSMPLADFVDYKSFAVFLHIEELSHLPGSGHTVDKLPADFKAPSVFDTTFWVPDADIESVVKKIKLVNDIAPTLQALGEEDTERRLEAINAARHYFLYRRSTSASLQGPNIVDAVVDTLCRRAQSAVSEHEVQTS